MIRIKVKRKEGGLEVAFVSQALAVIKAVRTLFVKQIVLAKVKEERGFSFYKWKKEVRLKTVMKENWKLEIGNWKLLKKACCSFGAFFKRSIQSICVGILYQTRNNRILLFLRKYNNNGFYIKRGITKRIAAVSVIALLFQATGLGAFAPSLSVFADEDEAGGLCAEVSADVVLMMDISNSMEEGESISKCEWTEMKQVPGQEHYTWFLNTKYDVTEQWCIEIRDGFDESSPNYSYKAPTYTPAIPSKINATKNATNSFLDNLELNDQSSLISFADVAILKEQLSNDHSATQTAVDNLVLASGDATNIGDAINIGNDELMDRGNPQAVKVMILLTDGKANEPNGNGYGEDSSDVIYAEAMAAEAATLGYKIFTIGLGNNTNTVMLGNIADVTSANYYHAPDGNYLEDFYTQIALDICGYGSISGCKYSDANADGEITGEEKLAGGLPDWEIILAGDFAANQDTDENGCYTFAGLAAGNYIISEGANTDKEPYFQTYPESGSYDITLSEGENREDADFGNADSFLCELIETPSECLESGIREYLFAFNYEYCGNRYSENIADETCACQVTDTLGECAEDGFRKHNYAYNYSYCGEDYSDNIADESCGCVASEDSRQCIGDNLSEVVYAYNFDYCGGNYTEAKEDLFCNSEYECEEWQGLECVDNSSREQCRTCFDQYQNSNEETRTVSDEICVCVSQETNRICASDGWADVDYSWNYNYCGEDYILSEEDSICVSVDDDGQEDEEESEGEGEDEVNEDDEDESGDDDNNNNNNIDEEEKPSSGGGYVGGLAISDESIRNIEASETSIKITWTTNQFSTSQVIYDTEPGKFDLEAGAPNYGYAYSKEGDDSGLEKVTGHSVTLTSLNPETTYYYRAVSTASPPTFSSEYTFVAPSLSKEEGTSEENNIEEGEVKGAETETSLAECSYLSEYIKLGADNNPVEVEKLERFLNEFEGENLAVNSVYEQVDFDAVSRFQNKYKENILSPWGCDKATGYVYITTKKKINELYCQREFPLTADQEAEIARLSVLTESVEMSIDNNAPEDSGNEAGEVSGVEDQTETKIKEGPQEETENRILLMGERSGGGTQEGGLMMKAFKIFGNLIWVVAVIIIGAAICSFPFIKTRKKYLAAK